MTKTIVTLKLDARLLREARVIAAEEGSSISALLASHLEALVSERKA
jgi:capsular polysaccharide biosynthesis protein